MKITVNTGFACIPAKAATAKLSATDWAVLHVIGLHADKDGRAFPSMSRIAEIIGMKRKNIPRTIKRLEECALLRRRRVPRPAGGWVNHYELVFEPIGVLNGEDTASEHVLSTEDTDGEHVLNGEDAEPGACPQNGARRVLTGEALTTQGTEEAYQEETQTVAVGVNGGRVLNTADTKADPAATCPWYVTNSTGFKICGKPAVDDGGYCAEHARL
jgi:hypothetical protein